MTTFMLPAKIEEGANLGLVVLVGIFVALSIVLWPKVKPDINQ